MDQRQYQAIKNRQRRLPAMLERARRNVTALEREAKRYGMIELLTNPKHVNKAWDEAIDEGRARTGYPDVPGDADK